MADEEAPPAGGEEAEAPKTLDGWLRQHLPKLVPSETEKARKGSVLVRDLRKEWPDVYNGYKDSSITQTLSYLAQGEESIIQRIEAGYGYFLRAPRPEESEGSEESEDATATDEPSPEELVAEINVRKARADLEERFRAFFMKLELLNGGNHPLRIRHEAAEGQRGKRGRDHWKFPDVVLVRWLVLNDGERVDWHDFRFRLALSQPLVQLASCELKVKASLRDARHYLLQCLSNSSWANRSTLAVACPIEDPDARAELKRLGEAHGVEVREYQLSEDHLRALPAPEAVRDMGAADFVKLSEQGGIPDNFDIITAGVERRDIDWNHLKDLRSINPDFRALVERVSRSVREGKLLDLG